MYRIYPLIMAAQHREMANGSKRLEYDIIKLI